MHPPEHESGPVDRSRRVFLGATGGLALSFTIVPRHVLGERASSRRAIGSMSRASASVAWEAATSPPSAASVPTSSPCATWTTSGAAGSFNAFPKARRYKDFRKMIDEGGDAIDAVTVGTPDHIHAVAAMAAIRAGKPCIVRSR